MERISIPDANSPTIEQQAGRLIVEAVEEAGLDPREASKNEMARQIIVEWGAGRWTRALTIRTLRNLLVLNPSLAPDTPTSSPK